MLRTIGTQLVMGVTEETVAVLNLVMDGNTLLASVEEVRPVITKGIGFNYLGDVYGTQSIGFGTYQDMKPYDRIQISNEPVRRLLDNIGNLIGHKINQTILDMIELQVDQIGNNSISEWCMKYLL